MTIQEPTVGAGGLIVAAMEFLRSNGINYSWNCFVDCGDIDARCFFYDVLDIEPFGSSRRGTFGRCFKIGISRRVVYARLHFRIFAFLFKIEKWRLSESGDNPENKIRNKTSNRTADNKGG